MRTPDFGSSSWTTSNPVLLAQWHPTRNGQLRPDDISPADDTLVWWLCARGHAWRATVGGRLRGRVCPVCQGCRL